ncbi:HlyD family secretion protein [Caulobacter sp. 17J80-11]|uniref:HlyD family secretion protein n=1 Tax=Caulobacter sp. 17J80-11 TaxID=2763502 RepID=UPI0016538ED4|nr:HlyD family secretion protein [Caulobacter sp. 17J80-11]MBC6983374.1 HlyD family secretion protein [Caulobacter sp. 17J80-11]
MTQAARSNSPAPQPAPAPAPTPAQTPAPVAPMEAPAGPAGGGGVPGKRVLWSVLLGLVAIAGVLLVLYAWRLPPFASAEQSTNDAYVRGQVTVISPQVAGYVTEVAVHDFQTVQEGQLLARIDDQIFRQRVEQAQANLHSAEAALANSAQAQASAKGGVAEARSGVAAAEAALAKAQADAKRASDLKAGGWVSQAQVDTAEAALRSAEANLQQAHAATGVAQTGVTTAVVGEGTLQAAVESARAALHLAQIDLDHTRVVAPQAGTLGEIGVRQGQSVAAGTQLMALVPDRVWVIANFKEAQIKNMRVGQPVRFNVDALGGATLTGKVEKISPAAGSEFAVIRPDNATGNFIKVAQRIPVRIAIDPGQPGIERLSPGMSVVAHVDTGR